MASYKVENINKELVELEKEYDNYINNLNLEVFGGLTSDHKDILNHFT